MWCQAGSIFTGQCPWAVSGAFVNKKLSQSANKKMSQF